MATIYGTYSKELAFSTALDFLKGQKLDLQDICYGGRLLLGFKRRWGK